MKDISSAEDHIYNFLRSLNIDCDAQEGLKETPERVAKAYEFWLSGYGKDPKEVLKVFENKTNYDELVFQEGIATYSMCEHHLAPFFGVTHIGYISHGKIVGLSKLARLVEILARRLQVQERLTQQIADALEFLSPDVGVVMRCRHMCMESRGVQKQGTRTFTSALRGALRTEPETRAEFMSFVKIADTATKSI